MLYRINDGSVSVGGECILSHIDFEIKGKEKIALVGKNGAGKTTLFRVIAGEIELDRDDKRQAKEIVMSQKITIGMLKQINSREQELTVNELLLENDRIQDKFSREYFEYELEYDKLFAGFGFAKEDKCKKIKEFSGGEQTKILLIKLLLEKNDILLLDEPTNHLDIKTLEWLEEYLVNYEYAVMIISHDRFFLDRVVNVVYDLEGGKLTKYAGNYTQYRTQKKKNLAILKKNYEHQQEEIKRLNKLIEQFKNKPRKAAFARSRQTILDRMDKIPGPLLEMGEIKVGDVTPEILGSKWPFEADKLKIGYDSEILEMSLRIKRGQKIGVIGENGTGKSTFLKTVVGLVEPYKGNVSIGNQVTIGYFDQQSSMISSEKSVLSHFHELFPALSEKEARRILGTYLFTGNDVSKKVSDLSGGEKSRLVLAEILNTKPNFLVLDEPTNHMDIWAKEVLEEAFKTYTGTILFVSHDRYFVSQVADAILLFDKGEAQYYPFNYEHYIYKSREESSEFVPGMLSAKDQALIAGLKAVPKAERHESRRLTSDEAYVDWKMGLYGKPLADAKEEYESLYATCEEMYFIPEDMEKELQRLWENWHAECLNWYDNYLEEEFDIDGIGFGELGEDNTNE